MTTENKLVPDIRPGSIETFTENFTPEGGGTQKATYKIVPAHPILNKVLDKTAWFRTHAGAVWYNRLAGLTLLQKIKNMEEGIAIPRDADVDTYVTPGHYYSGSAATTATILHIPDGIKSGFSLDVKKVGSNVVQEITLVNGANYKRGKTSGGWWSWLRTANDGVEFINLTSNLNENFIDNSTFSPSLYIYKKGNITFLTLSIFAKNLTGSDTILTSGFIPGEMRPVDSLYFTASGRNTGAWANATYYNTIIKMLDGGSIVLVTGSEREHVKYVNASFAYITN